MRALVCGGRKYARGDVVNGVLNKLYPEVVISGMATGADSLAAAWADAHPDVTLLPFPAKWQDIHRPGAVVKKRWDGTLYDAAAGGVRNQRMLDEGKPDCVIAFPGGSGTEDMIRRAQKAKVPVIYIKDEMFPTP